jgi:hypothetical protein
MLTYYDDGYYDCTDGLGPGSFPAGRVAEISDIYYYYEPFEKLLQISQTEWLSDGMGDVYISPNSPATFDYYGITFDNITSDVHYLGEDNDFIQTVLPAWKHQYAEHIAKTQINIPKIQNISKSVLIQNKQILKAVFNHQNIRTGRNGGDTQTPVYVWTQTLYSHGNKRGDNAFSSDTLGILLGGEVEVSKKLNVGLGYGYSNTDSTTSNENISMDNNSYFLYGDYKIKTFFINAIAAYNSGEYKYSVNANTGKTSDYFASVIFGTDIGYGFSPEIGLRYNNIKIQDHNTYETTVKNNIWTGSIGTKYKSNIDKFTFGGKMLIDYDFYKSNDDIDILILDQTIHLSEQNKDKALGAEFGIWTGYNVANIDLRIDYDLFVQSDYTNHTGRLSFKYGF